MMINLILILLVITAILVLLPIHAIVAVISLSVFSLLCSLTFFLLKAPDVAIAEAAVGAGLSTFIFVWAIRKTTSGRKE